LKVVLFCCAVIFLTSLVIYLIERQTNPGIKTFFDGLYWTVVTVATVGYGDKVPVTFWGRIVAISAIFIGVGIMGTVTGRIASFLMERQMKEEKGLLDYSNLKGHFIICGWKKEMNRVLHEILNSNPSLDPQEIVLINKASLDEMDMLRNDPLLKGIKFVNGDFIEDGELNRAGIKAAGKILVLADHLTLGDLQQIDTKTVIAVMTIKNLNRKAYVCAELLDTKYEKYLKLSHCDEVLLSREFSRSILASASSGTGLSHIISSLLQGDGGGSIASLDIPDSFIGKTYQELKIFYKKKDNSLLIGILENTGNIAERKRNALREAQMNPDISQIIPELKQVKTLVANEPIINPQEDYIIHKYSRGIVITKKSFVRQETISA
jgi:voltage-gated potassium channel